MQSDAVMIASVFFCCCFRVHRHAIEFQDFFDDPFRHLVTLLAKHGNVLRIVSETHAFASDHSMRSPAVSEAIRNGLPGVNPSMVAYSTSFALRMSSIDST